MLRVERLFSELVSDPCPHRHIFERLGRIAAVAPRDYVLRLDFHPHQKRVDRDFFPEAKRLHFLLACPVCNTEKLIHAGVRTRYEPTGATTRSAAAGRRTTFRITRGRDADLKRPHQKGRFGRSGVHARWQ
jgi:hypothetical protein